MRLLVFLSMVLALVGCSTSYSPAHVRPVFEARNSPKPVPVPLKKPSYRVVQQKLRTQSGGTIQVQQGQTLYGLSRIYGVALEDLVAVNRLRAPYTLAIGQSLTLPAARRHTVKKGETGYSISRRYGVTLSSLMRANRIGAPYTLSIGQSLAIPGGASASASSARPSSATAKPRAKPVAPPRSRPGATTAPIPSRTSSQFAWPIKGRIASGFGPKSGGLHNDGINILARQGSPVRAAEAGVVVYASNALEGYGNLILIKHASGYITAYAHNERLLVAEGATVRRGDIISRVGTSGGVSDPQLHFEIRRGRRALDPLKHLERT